MIKQVVLLFLVCISLQTFANTAKLGFSEVLITNNTDDKIKITTKLDTDDDKIRRGRDWNGEDTLLSPYESKRILWFSRHEHLQLNKTYRFEIIANSVSYPNSPFTIALTEKRKVVYGTNLTSQIIFPDRSNRVCFIGSDFQKFDTHFWNQDYSIHARSWLPSMNFFHNFQFVLNTKKPTTNTNNSPNEFFVLSYNTQLMPFYADTVNDLNNPKIRATLIPALVKNYDVVIIQELFDRELRESFINYMKPFYPFHTRLVGEGGNKVLNGGVMIFSKWPILAESQMVFRAGVNMDALASKGVGYAAINKNGQVYHIFGTHLQSGSKIEEINARILQLMEFSAFIQHLGIPFNQRLIFAGDFNIDEFGSEIYNLLTSLNVHLDKNMGYPFSADGSINTMKVGGGKSRIDYIFSSDTYARPKYAYNKVFILRALNDQRMWPKFDLSDHFPVEAYFDYR